MLPDYTAVSLAGVFRTVFQKEKVHRTSKAGFVLLNVFLLLPLCRACPEWIFLRFQSLDLGLWNADRVHLCKNIPGTCLLLRLTEKRKVFVMLLIGYCILALIAGGGKDTAQSDGDGPLLVTFDIYRAYPSEISLPGERNLTVMVGRFPDRRHPV